MKKATKDIKPKAVDVLDVLKKLPAESYIWDVVRPGISIIRRGVSGHYPQEPLPAELRHIKQRGDYVALHEVGYAFVAAMNEKAGVTKAQAEAMQMGSMFGWETPGADPDKMKAFSAEVAKGKVA